MAEAYRHLSARREVIACGGKVVHVDGLLVDKGTPGNPVAPNRPFGHVVGDRSVMRPVNEVFAVLQKDEGIVGVTELRCAFGNGIEHGLDVGRRSGDGAQDRAGRRLLLECLGQLEVAGLDLLIEPPQLLGRLVDIVRKRAQLVPVVDDNRWAKSPAAIWLRRASIFLTGSTSDQEMM